MSDEQIVNALHYPELLASRRTATSVRSLRELQAACYRTAWEHGFHDDDGDDLKIDQKLLLIVSEVAEAQNELRDGHGPRDIYYKNMMPRGGEVVPLPGAKPEGFPIELADALIRILDLAGTCGIDLQQVVEQKMAYNEKRPRLHGRSF